MITQRDGRLSLDECRRVIGSECRLDDGEILALREQLYALAAVAYAAFRAEPQAGLESLDDSDRCDIEERAAILEFDAKLPRSAAERIALAQRARHRRQ